MVESNIAATVEGFINKEFSQYHYISGHWFTFHSQKLEIDFLIPSLKVAIEVQGEQHYKFTKLFHKTAAGLRSQKYRDSLKSEWCDQNNYKLIELGYKEIPKMSSGEFKQLVLQKALEKNGS